MDPDVTPISSEAVTDSERISVELAEMHDKTVVVVRWPSKPTVISPKPVPCAGR